MKMKSLMAALTLGVAVMSSGAYAETTFTGDLYQQREVISRLDVESLETGLHRYYFLAEVGRADQPSFVPVIVAKGAKQGKTILVQGAVHGDETNGIAVVQRVMADLKPESMSGTVIGIPAVSVKGVEANSRHLFTSVTALGEDPNRLFPGKENGKPAERYAHRIWNDLWNSNKLDMVVDVHTSGQKTEFPLFIYADLRNEDIKRMVKMIPASVVKNDEGEAGSVETSFVSVGIPAITLEVGNSNRWNQSLIERAVAGVNNIITDQGIVNGKAEPMDQETIYGDNFSNIRAKQPGFVELKVELLQEVKRGDLIAVKYNVFGDQIEEYRAEVDGHIAQVADRTGMDPNAIIARIIY